MSEPRAIRGSGNRRRLRFGIIWDGAAVPAWQAECVQALLASDRLEPALRIIARTARRAVPRTTALWRLYDRLFVRRRSKALRPVDLNAVLSQLPIVHCPTSRAGDSPLDSTGEGELTEICSSDLDFILGFGRGALRGEILQAPRYGVWSFRHDFEEVHGIPACFWDIDRGEPVTGASLERLTGPPDGGIALHQGTFKTIGHSYVRTYDEVLLGVAEWPARVGQEIQETGAGPAGEHPSPLASPLGRRPSGWRTAIFVVKLLARYLRHSVEKVLWSEQWNVGVVDQPIAAFLVPGARPAVRWLPPRARHRFLADPFGVRRETGMALLVEDYDYRTDKGYISVLESRNGQWFSPPRPIINLPYHLSYPYTFQYEGDIYCILETARAREVTLYRAQEFPDRWQRLGTLLEDVALVDSTVFQHGGRWWLLGSRKDDWWSSNQLYAWHASDLRGPWVQHALNPVKTDVRSSRPAGTPFVHDGQLYRPAQDCSQTYGGAVVLNRVLQLTPTAFDEEVAAVVPPYADGPYPNGLHTISAAADMTFIDGKRNRFFVWPAFQQMLAPRIRKLTRS